MASFGPKGGKKGADDSDLSKLQASIASLSEEFSKISLACADASKSIKMLGDSAAQVFKNLTKASIDATAALIKETSKSKGKTPNADKAPEVAQAVGESEESLIAGFSEVASEISQQINAYTAEISDKFAQIERQSGIEKIFKMLGGQKQLPKSDDVFDESAALKQAFFEAKRIQQEINDATRLVASEFADSMESAVKVAQIDPIEQAFNSVLEETKQFGSELENLFGEEIQSVIDASSARMNEWGKEIQSIIDKYKPSGAGEASADTQKKGQAKGGIFANLIRPINETALLFRNISRSMGLVFEAVEAVNPALMFQLSMAFRDLYGVMGRAFQPLVQAFVVGIRMLADMLVPVANQLRPIFQSIASSALKLFVSLFPAFQALMPILGLFLQVLDFVIKGITIVAEPLIFVFGALAAILIYQSIPALITFVTSLLTTSAIMTAGLSLLIGALGWIVAKIFGFGSKMNFKPGSSLGAGTRQSSYTSFEEYGRNLMQQSIGGSTQAAALQTAQYTRESRDYLAQIAGKGNQPRQDGGVGVGVKPDKIVGSGADWGQSVANWVGGWFV